ncbi:MAG: pyrimidine 5'-nucleotidase [Anaerolineaceae bacterium]|nr:pyrimidine 5'-nucleotidase [Anaerolineae bacterium]MBL1172265.1 pyrimidine 5'-nucleotidase [Chloroflexota bacterium]MCL4822826.1 pyrimidine 5'-nucleotidase [Anaerolineales bacterium]MDL1925379.1 pyrimidine 5'-nucleotidase [Anaerolineae bacterium AMX1]GJQ39982.1 MAG: pyrimidine 5'-nucleotidase [Anaerolineaceae bacterium]
MKFAAVFFDLDDTLYPASTGLWLAIKERMNIYMRDRMGFDPAEIPTVREKYFREYGTTLRGLQANHQINVDDFLAFVHDLPLRDYLTPDPTLRPVIASIPTRKWIFTNADVSHARRVLAALELDGLFDGIVDVNAVAPYCKPMPESFRIAMESAGETDPARCAMIDDLPRTTRAAREFGMYGILYGQDAPQPDADASFTDWRVLPALLNGSKP